MGRGGLLARKDGHGDARVLAARRRHGLDGGAIDLELRDSGPDRRLGGLEADLRDTPSFLDAFHLGRRLDPTHLAQDVACVHDTAARVAEPGLETLADDPVGPVAPELEADGAPQPALGGELLDDELATVAHGLGREDARIRRDRGVARDQLLALGIEEDEVVVVHVNRNAARGRPLLGALGLIPLALVAGNVVEAFGALHEQEVDAVRGHARADAREAGCELLRREGLFGVGIEIAQELFLVAHGILPRGRGPARILPAPPRRSINYR